MADERNRRTSRRDLTAAERAARKAAAPSPVQRYRSSGVTAAARFVRETVSEDAAAVFSAFAAIGREDAEGASLDFERMIPCLGGIAATATTRLRRADAGFRAAFLHPLLPDGSIDRDPGLADDGGVGRLKMSRDMIGLIRHPPSAAAPPSAIFDETGMNWISVVRAASQSRRGHHLVLRSAGAGDRTAADFASLVAACGVEAFILDRDEHLRWAMLRAELHGGGRSVVVADGDFLLVGADAIDDDEFQSIAVQPKRSVLALAAVASGIVPQLSACRNTYVWRIPERGSLPAELNGRIGCCMGPLRYDAAWSAAFLKARAKGIGPAGTQALLNAVDDVRDAEAIASLATTIATAAAPDAPTIDEACRLLAASFEGAPRAFAAEAVETAPFDERLIACKSDGIALLHRGDALARGGRVLAVGPPGGGKSSYAKALGARIAAARGVGGTGIVLLEPAELLAKSWGTTERLIAALFARADRERATIVADEFDSLCAVREAAAPISGNAYLIRCLTNEFLRQLDAHPSVPLIATANDLSAVDPAARRRFTVLIEIGDELDAGQERLAWDVILGMKPPDGWSACRAAVADFTSAARRCQLLGRGDAGSHAAAIIEARAARLGPAAPAGRPKRNGPLH